MIRDYREMTVSSWPERSSAGLAPILARLYPLVDPQAAPGEGPNGIVTPSSVQVHVLHLASSGLILPHVDNVEASGSVIAGVSLGDTRVLRMSRAMEEGQHAAFDVLLESGSVYVQRCVLPLILRDKFNCILCRDDVRYSWKHEIPNTAQFQGSTVGGGQRMSVMLRVSRSLSVVAHLPSKTYSCPYRIDTLRTQSDIPLLHCLTRFLLAIFTLAS